MTLKIERGLDGMQFGARVSGITVKDIRDFEVQNRLRRLWVEEGVLVFEAEQPGTEFQIELSKIFGSLITHPLEEIWVEGNPELVSFKYVPANETTYFVNNVELGGYIPWHVDLIYETDICRGGILRSVQTPANGGETAFIDEIGTYERLPSKMKKRIEDLEVVYQFRPDVRLSPFACLRDDVRAGKESDQWKALLARDKPLVAHKLVVPQQETGRKALNLSAVCALYIPGLERAESDELLHELTLAATDERYAYVHRWADQHMVLWDNWRITHKALGVPVGAAREVQRTTIHGDYRYGRAV